MLNVQERIATASELLLFQRIVKTILKLVKLYLAESEIAVALLEKFDSACLGILSSSVALLVANIASMIPHDNDLNVSF